MTIKDKSKTFLASIIAKLIDFNPYGIESLILADLIANGFSGDECLKEFKKRQALVRPAIEAMIVEAESVALGKGEYSTYDEIFGAEEGE